MNSKSGAGADNGEPREDELEQLLLLLSEPTRGRGSVADAVEELHEAGLITPSGHFRNGQPVWVATKLGMRLEEELRRSRQ
jgi:hypothetical protein